MALVALMGIAYAQGDENTPEEEQTPPEGSEQTDPSGTPEAEEEQQPEPETENTPSTPAPTSEECKEVIELRNEKLYRRLTDEQKKLYLRCTVEEDNEYRAGTKNTCNYYNYRPDVEVEQPLLPEEDRLTNEDCCMLSRTKAKQVSDHSHSTKAIFCLKFSHLFCHIVVSSNRLFLLLWP